MNDAAENSPEWSDIDPQVTRLVREIIARVADETLESRAAA